MIGVITGDIIDSKKVESYLYLANLKDILSRFGETPENWEIYRGDSFQLQLPAERSLLAAILIKASINQIRHLDVRMAIGLGEITYPAGRITESNGTAFVYSGECFEHLKRSTLRIRSSDAQFDESINLMINLAELSMKNWTAVTAKIVSTALKFPELNQKMLAEKLNKSQGNISEGLSRAGYHEIKAMIDYFQKTIREQ